MSKKKKAKNWIICRSCNDRDYLSNCCEAALSANMAKCTACNKAFPEIHRCPDCSPTPVLSKAIAILLVIAVALGSCLIAPPPDQTPVFCGLTDADGVIRIPVDEPDTLFTMIVDPARFTGIAFQLKKKTTAWVEWVVVDTPFGGSPLIGATIKTEFVIIR